MRLQPRSNVRNLPPYPLGESQVSGVDRVINLASNENAVQPSEAVLAACRDALLSVNRYPEASAAELRQALARHHGLDRDRIVCANGSSELISLLCHAYLSPGEEALVARYGYLYFATATRIAGAIPVPVRSDGQAFCIESALAAVTPRTKIMFLDNPNNPTGRLLDQESVRALRKGLREDVLLVLDSAYAEYVTDTNYNAGADLVESHDNVVMLRTFSKIYGLAGLRVGWAYAPLDIADLLHRVRQPNNLGAPAIAGAIAALDERERVKDIRETNAHLRLSMTEAMQALGFEVAPSQTNFLLATIPPDQGINAIELYERLKQQGIIVRPMSAYGLPESLRITIGTEPEMSEFQSSIMAEWPQGTCGR